MVIIEWCKVKVRAHVGMFTKPFFSNDFYFSFMLGLMDFNDTAILCSRPNSRCQQLSVLINLYNLFSLGLFL